MNDCEKKLGKPRRNSNPKEALSRKADIRDGKTRQRSSDSWGTPHSKRHKTERSSTSNAVVILQTDQTHRSKGTLKVGGGGWRMKRELLERGFFRQHLRQIAQLTRKPVSLDDGDRDDGGGGKNLFINEKLRERSWREMGKDTCKKKKHSTIHSWYHKEGIRLGPGVKGKQVPVRNEKKKRKFE